MTKENSPLGKGLGSLLGDRPKQQASGLMEVATEDLTPGQYQPRKKMYRDTLEELAKSIKQQGVLQPLVARRLASGRYEIVVGERRWRAAQMAGLNTVPTMVRDLNNNETAKIALIENLQREDLNAMDQARGLQRLQKEFNLSQESLGEAVGKSRSAVTNLLRLLKLSAEVQELLEQGKLEMGHARALLSLDEGRQNVFALEIIKKGFSVRETEKYVSEKKETPAQKASKNTKDPNTIVLEREISEILGATTEIKHNKQGKGKMVVNFKTLEILQGILEKIKS
jgi:ParB family chromosome partitioning protein